ncbi:hypothetical protein HJG60_010840 [Phyllostomus discolor]|uniref:Uncharacterized protein n=1 Tax=Phyllostomus discolor TaxID=89673 RepID=A0A834A6S6_9CHIR|nr:hypothetical protein HJG60_010840 [Phyllostomus discolor]
MFPHVHVPNEDCMSRVYCKGTPCSLFPTTLSPENYLRNCLVGLLHHTDKEIGEPLLKHLPPSHSKQRTYDFVKIQLIISFRRLGTPPLCHPDEESLLCDLRGPVLIYHLFLYYNYFFICIFLVFN